MKEKKSQRETKSLRKILQILVFIYIWGFFNTFIHELGHVLVACLFSRKMTRIDLGVISGKLTRFRVKGTEVRFGIFPFWGYIK